MKYGLFLATLILVAINSSGAEIVLSGVYQGKNIYVQNPFSGEGNKDFCTIDVYVNNIKTSTNINSSAYEVDLSAHKLNDAINLKIIHKDDCTPKILNPQVLKSTSSFNFNTVTVSKDHLIWSTKGEKPSGKMVIEHFINNSSWGTIKEIKNKESAIMCSYEIPINHSSGSNKYRVKYVEQNGQIFYSQVAEFVSDLVAVDIYPKRVTDIIYLTREADYELLDAYGNSKMKGRGKEINVTKESGGVYYVNTDNKTFKVFKR